jgi:hypothetical protein
MKQKHKGVLLCLLLAILLVSPRPTLAQGPSINIKDCFSDILVDRTHIVATDDLKYALQEEWSKEMYDKATAGGKLNLIIYDVPIGASYDQASEKVNKERYSRAEDLNYSSYRSLSRAALNPEAKNIINQCLDKASRGQLGFSYVPWVHAEDPTLVTLQIFWHWPDEPISITTQRIDGATVEDNDRSHPNKLFGYSLLHPWEYNRIDANQSRSVTLKRARPDDNITIVLETSPNIQLPPITIAGEAKPKKCTPIQVSADEFGRPYSKDFGPVDTSTLTAKDAAGHPIPLGNGAKWVWEVDLAQQGVPEDATLTSVLCSKYGVPGDFMDLLGANPPWNVSAPGFIDGKKATCIGWWQNAGRHVTMKVQYSKFGYSCPDHDWILKEGKWQAADAPTTHQASQ